MSRSNDFVRFTLMAKLSSTKNTVTWPPSSLAPAIETLEKMARAMEVPMYQLFYDGEKPPKPNIPMTDVAVGWGQCRSRCQNTPQISHTNESGRSKRCEAAVIHGAENVSEEAARSGEVRLGLVTFAFLLRCSACRAQPPAFSLEITPRRPSSTSRPPTS